MGPMSQKSRIFDLENFTQLAQALEISEFELFKNAYRSNAEYTIFKKKKCAQTYRTIAVPPDGLKEVQKKIVQKILDTIPLASECTGYRSGLSIVANVTPHCGRSFVFSTDIENFFESITSERVVEFFLRLGFSFPLASVLASLTTYNGTLPIGAPSSPALANLICFPLDSELADYATSKNWNYTRYGDDLTFSGDTRFSLQDMRIISDIVESEGFSLNIQKTRFTRRNDTQVVSGLVVNEKPNLPRAKRRMIRAIFHQAKHFPERFKDRTRELENHVGQLTMLAGQSEEVLKYKAIINSLV